MRFFTTALAAIGAVSALTTPNPALSLLKRQPVVEGTGCAFVEVDLPLTVDGLCATPALNGLCTFGVRLGLGTLLTTGGLAGITNPIAAVCLCAEAGVLTGQSVADLGAQLTANVPLLTTVNTALGTLIPNLNLLAIVRPLAAAEVGSAIAGCPYPDNSVPVCRAGETCAFQCRENYFLCDAGAVDTCLVVGSPCGTASRRRRRQVSNNLLCDAGRTSCALPGNKFGFECLDTQADVESCGGCAFPLPGAQKGRDCTAIANVADVDCVRGSCQVRSCLRGFVLQDGECVGKGSVGGIVDDASQAVGGLAGFVGKLASSDRFRAQNARDLA